MLPVAWLLASVLALAPARVTVQDNVTPGPGALSLPPGPVARLLATLGDAPARALPSPWPGWDDRSATGWGGELPWRRWVELLRAEAPPHNSQQPHASLPARRAELAQLALLQGRDGDAWAHLLACGSEPALVANLLPRFVPGIPPGADPRALPDGVLLRPALPPTEAPRAGLRWLAGTKIACDEFVVGTARCSLSVSVDRDGLEVALHHLGGGPARVRVLPPLPRGIDPGLVFADWEKLPGHVGPVEFLLDEEANEHTLWLTFHPRAEVWPSPRLETLRSPAPGREIRVESPSGDEAYLRCFAEALGELFGVRSCLRPEGQASAPGLEPLVLTFSSGPGAERKLAELIGLAEAFALSEPLR